MRLLLLNCVLSILGREQKETRKILQNIEFSLYQNCPALCYGFPVVDAQALTMNKAKMPVYGHLDEEIQPLALEVLSFRWQPVSVLGVPLHAVTKWLMLFFC